VSSNPRQAPVYFRLRRLTRGVSSGGATCSLCLALYAIMIHRIVLQFYMCFLYIFTIMWSIAFSLSCFLFELCNLVAGGPCLRYLHPTWITWLFFYPGSRAAEWLPLEKTNANGGSKVCSLLSLVPYPKRVQFASLKMSSEFICLF
jgi:hypothetical protein